MYNQLSIQLDKDPPFLQAFDSQTTKSSTNGFPLGFIIYLNVFSFDAWDTFALYQTSLHNRGRNIPTVQENEYFPHASSRSSSVH